jgi:Na+/proline symporter
MGWDIFWTNIVMGGLLIIYTVSGGARAVAYTQQLQLIIIFVGMFLAGYMIVHLLPANMGFWDALKISGAAGKMNVITTGVTDSGFDWKDRYNLISGTIGGFFLALSYFGTDQSQVGRYLTAKNLTESRMGLLMNGLVKVPMQFFILLLGALLFTFYQFHQAPIFYNQSVETRALQTPAKEQLMQLSEQYEQQRKALSSVTLKKLHAKEQVSSDWVKPYTVEMQSLQKQYKATIKEAVPDADTNDTNYIFLRFVIDHLPVGLVGLLIAIIFLAAWGSIAAALNSLASCTMVDFYLRFKKTNTNNASDESQYRMSKWLTFFWGVFCVITAEFATGMGSLIEAVNILGSLFYGVILGIFLVAFYLKKVQGNAVFWAAVIGELLVIACFLMDRYNIIGLGFLWLNVVGAIAVVILAIILQPILRKPIAAQ